jgi:hypothetical protein
VATLIEETGKRRTQLVGATWRRGRGRKHHGNLYVTHRPSIERENCLENRRWRVV